MQQVLNTPHYPIVMGNWVVSFKNTTPCCFICQRQRDCIRYTIMSAGCINTVSLLCRGLR